MASFLSKHPFAVDAWFDRSVVLTYALPKSELQPLIPVCLELDTFNEEWAFLAVAMVQTRDLRPAGFPRFLGQDFFLIGYRIFVRYHTLAGKRLRGLYILKSETDKRSMNLLGRLFTRYSYDTTDISQDCSGSISTVRSRSSGLEVTYESPTADISLPPGAPFATWQEARRFAGPLPFTFSYDATKGQVLIIEGRRESWQPKPIRVASHHVPFLEELGLKSPVLASAFLVENIPYHWKKGRIEQWQH